MTTPRVCLVGCGSMGRRHLRGYGALAAAGRLEAELSAVYDVRTEAAEAAASEAARLLGTRPRVHTSMKAVLADRELTAADVVTEPANHHVVAVPLLLSGRHVICETPLGPTVRAATVMVLAAQEGGAVLATAEHHRRCGQGRLARAAIKSGLLGRLHAMVVLMIGGSDRTLSSPRRHRRESGAIALDVGCRLTDLVDFHLGPIETAYGRGFVAEPVRRAGNGIPVVATGDDAVSGVYRTRGGVDVHLAYIPSGPGSYVQCTVHGSAGSLVIPVEGSTGLVELRLADTVLSGPEVADRLGAAGRLDDLTVALLGPDGIGSGPAEAVDAACLAIELHDFLAAVESGRPPDVDGMGGVRSLAAVLALMESQLLDRPVHIDELLDGSVSDYQDELDEVLGLVDEDAR